MQKFRISDFCLAPHTAGAECQFLPFLDEPVGLDDAVQMCCIVF